MFTFPTSRAVHQEMTKSQTAEEFKRKLNASNARIRKSEQLQDHLAKQEIRWRFNLSKSPCWGGMYERLIKDVKKTLHKTLGKIGHIFEQFEAVVIDIEKHLNNRPLTYLGSKGDEEQVFLRRT